MTRILLTGASGFVGAAVQARLLNDEGFALHSAYRQLPQRPLSGLEAFQVGDLAPDTDWQAALDGVEIVIHCAARVHVMTELEADPLAAFRRANVEGTLRLAEQSASAGVRRFIYLSSIKVNGEGTLPGRPYTANDEPAPQDPYGVSKWEAEQALQALALRTGMEVVIIRPVLVYGPGVKANFRSMMGWLSKGVPLPFGAITNKRSLVALDNLVDLIVTCIRHPAAADQIFLVSDDEDLSTSQLLRRMAQALGRPARLLPVPMGLLTGVAGVLGRTALSQRLCGSLAVDIEKTRKLLGWQPPLSVDAALARTAKDFLASRG
ncbi:MULTISPECIES: UDP-glucose 4-epimerase family protein [Pseudomonas]|uniref:UDP-glucose 4-epimerase family protein n=1 Tax=Pseudomonas TaxID=286 RepID=UPI0006B5D54A|nr:SDR family oxidoreductase [Pseudomonas fuscovaginae]KPA96659.1 nucleoside-diphosphate-sugar epimerase [Pseudomonas fuscovaginae]